MQPFPWAVPLILAATLAALPGGARAQDALTRDIQLRAHLDLVLTAADTPGGAGLLDAALRDAWAAVEAARAAAREPGDLVALQTHARRVLQAVDPARGAAAPGGGYGAQRAVREARTMTSRAWAADAGAADVARVAPTVDPVAQAVETQIEALAAAAERVLAAATAERASAEARALPPLAEAVVFGAPLTGDGRLVPDAPGLVQWRVALRLVLAHRAAQGAVDGSAP